MALTIHLGAHKTATTHLQQSLRQVRRNCGRAAFSCRPGVLRDRGARLSGSGRSRRIAHGQRTGPRWPRSAIACRNAAVRENIPGGTSRRRIVGPQGCFYPGAGRRLQRLIALAGVGLPRCVWPCATRRRSMSRPLRCSLPAAKEIDIEDYLVGRDPARFDWAALVARLSAVPGVARIIVWRYEDYPRCACRSWRGCCRPDWAPSSPRRRARTKASRRRLRLALSRPMPLRTPTCAPLSMRPASALAARRSRARCGLADEVHARSAVCYAEECRLAGGTAGAELLLPWVAPRSPPLENPSGAEYLGRCTSKGDLMETRPSSSVRSAPKSVGSPGPPGLW